MKKDLIRSTYQEKRNKLKSEEIEALSIDIANQSLKLPIWEKTYFHIYLSIIEKKEVNTEYLLHILQGRDKSIVVPRSNFSTGEMEHVLLQENTVIKKSKFSIPEPEDGISVPIEKIEVVFVPLLSFDENGNRIGYGKGFYDRFLSNVNENCILVGLSFFEPINSIETNKFDIPLNYCITPYKLYIF